MPTVVTLHGTFVSGPAEGDQWWQRGSAFADHLGECIEATVGTLGVEPLLWSGENSESARRKAALDLLARCELYEKSGEAYLLVGHSHGGSVISDALLFAAERKLSLPHLVKAITVGTPFLHLSRTPFFSRIPVQVFQILSLLAALYVATTSATTPGTILNGQLIKLDPAFDTALQDNRPLGLDGKVKFSSDMKKWLAEEATHRRFDTKAPMSSPKPPPQPTLADQVRDKLHLPNEGPAAYEFSTEQSAESERNEIDRIALEQLQRTVPEPTPEARALTILFNTFVAASVFASVLIVNLLVNSGIEHRIIRAGNVKKAKASFGSRWFGVGHRLDEAVGVLSRLATFTPSTAVAPEIARRSNAAVYTASCTLLVFLMAMWVVLFSSANGIQPANSSEFIFGFFSALLTSPMKALKIGIAVGVVAAGALISVLVIWGIARLIVLWAGARFDSYLQKRVLGMDVPGQRSLSVSAKPMWSDQSAFELPNPIADRLSTFSDSQSLAVISAIRRQLYDLFASDKPLSFSAISEATAAFEMTHTAYFDEPKFRKLLFAAMIDEKNFRARAGFRVDPDLERAQKWLATDHILSSDESAVHAPM